MHGLEAVLRVFFWNRSLALLVLSWKCVTDAYPVVVVVGQYRTWRGFNNIIWAGNNENNKKNYLNFCSSSWNNYNTKNDSSSWSSKQEHQPPAIFLTYDREHETEHFGAQPAFRNETTPRLFQNGHESTTTTTETKSNSLRIRSIRMQNLAGMIGAGNDDGLGEPTAGAVTFTNINNNFVATTTNTTTSQKNNNNISNLIAITGETGTGKSLLFAKTVELLKGGKAPTSLLLITKESSSPVSGFCELSLQVDDHHLVHIKQMLEALQVDCAELLKNQTITFRRTLFQKQPSLLKQSKQKVSSSWLSSECCINGQIVSLKVLRAMVSPLVTVVDASEAVQALERSGEARMALLDHGGSITNDILSRVRATQEHYRKCRHERETIEKEMECMNFDPIQDEELLIHWIDELDAFSRRATQFCHKCCIVNTQDEPSSRHFQNGPSVAIHSVEWGDNQSMDHQQQQQSSSSSTLFVSAMYETLRKLQKEMRSLDAQITAIRGAIDALSLLSTTGSAMLAVETARRLIFNIVETDTHIQSNDPKYTTALEHSHELLNILENDIVECTRFIEDNPAGLLQLAESKQANYNVAVEAVDELLADWGALARKHGVLPTLLPLRHQTLKNELDGSMSVSEQLPRAMDAEKEALIAFEKACKELRSARKHVARTIMRQVNQRLPSLGMESSIFCIAVSQVRNCRDRSVFANNAVLGCDAVEFYLEKKETGPSETNSRRERMGLTIGEAASAGEKARLLLALECASPGAISAMIKEDQSSFTSSTLRAITIYDEIDAHVGGRAVVAVAHMLAEQSTNSQILAITHSPSVAAIADAHFVVRKAECLSSPTTTVVTTIGQVVDDERTMELARMTSGDVAPDEAVVFAEALMRDIPRRDSINSNKYR